jgi:hypothetical protein
MSADLKLISSGPEDLLEPRAEDDSRDHDYDADETDIADDTWEYEV